MRRQAFVSMMLVGLALLVGATPALAEKSKRGVSVMPSVQAGSLPITGEYWALIVGIDQYQYVPKLQSAVRDAQAVREVLVQRYGFAHDHVVEIINGQATREGIENAFYQLRKKAGKDDSVFIYYAGHGQIDQEDQIGYWVPVEGKAQSPGTFISNARIRDEIARMKARHVYLVADSCFSGTLFASSRALPPLNDKFFQRLYANKSRWGFTSGMNEPVTDQGKDGHSMFAYFLLKLLKENDEPYLVPSHIYDQIAPLIGRNTDQQPRSEPLQNAGDEGGQFVFRLVSTAGGTAPAVKSNPPGLSASPKGVDASAYDDLEHLTKVAQAREQAWTKVQAFAAQKSVTRETRVAKLDKFLQDFPNDNPYQADAEALKQQIQSESREQASKPIEEARARPYAPPSTDQRVTGKERAIIKTKFGDMEIKFFPDAAPRHVENFIKLAKDGFYNGTIFHRVIPGFMIQGGDPNTRDPDKKSQYGTGGPGYTVKAEFNNIHHKRGILSMARASDPDSAGSQFFIIVESSPFLDNKYTVFGEVVRGLNVIDKIVNQSRDGRDVPNERIEMTVTIVE